MQRCCGHLLVWRRNQHYILHKYVPQACNWQRVHSQLLPFILSYHHTIILSGSLTQKVLQGPIGIGIGLVFGYLYGMMLPYLPSRNAVSSHYQTIALHTYILYFCTIYPCLSVLHSKCAFSEHLHTQSAHLMMQNSRCNISGWQQKLSYI